MNTLRVVSPTGCLGLNPLDEEAFEIAVAAKPDVIGVDAGSLDPGPFYLGSGLPHVARFQAKRELTLYMQAIHSLSIPLLIGTAGGSGGRPHIEWNLQIIKEVAEELGKRFRVAVIDTTIDKEWLRERAAQGIVSGCDHDSPLRPEDIDSCTEIVAQIGVEPYIRALDEHSPDIVLAGRSCDDAIFAALPILNGFARGPALHLGKILECGGLCLEPSLGHEPVIGTLYDDYFTVEAANPRFRCTHTSVASHAIYERRDPAYQAEPGGFLDMRETTIDQIGDRTVKISGSRWEPADAYLVKLEGAEKVGYRSIFIGATRDPAMLQQIDSIVDRALLSLTNQMAKQGLTRGRDFHAGIRVYGKSGVPVVYRDPTGTPPPREVCVIFDIVAPSQQMADDICYFGKNFLVWCDFDGRTTTAGNMAYPWSPSIQSLGEVYRLRVHHLLPVEDQAMFPVRIVNV